MKKIFLGVLALSTLFAVVLFLRFVGFDQDSLANIAPITAMALCFGLFYNRSSWGMALAFGALFLSDVFITALTVQKDPSLSFWSLLFSPTVGLRYLVYGAFFAVAWFLRARRSAKLTLAITPVATLTFYTITNTVAWASSTPPYVYAKTMAGWWQSQTVGLPIPGAPPSYLFLRKAMICDGIFTVLFITLMVWLPRKLQQPIGNRSTDSPLNASKNVV